MRKYLYFLLLAGLVGFFACQKETSFELPNTPAEGSLQDDASGDCLPKTINGAYAVGQALTNSNSITIAVNVVKTGTYTIGTDTVNGYYFRGTGSFTTLGVNNVTLRGNGTPFAQGTNNFVVSFDSTFCDIQVVVTQPGVGTLAGSPNACAPITVNGSYSPGTTMGATHSAVVQVNVTVAGAFSIITDTVAGIWYTFSGPLATGTQSVTLQANGAIPSAEAAGSKSFKVKLGSSQCSFNVNVVAQGAGTLGGAPNACSNTTVNGTYTNGVPLTAGNNVVIEVNVTTPGSFNITTNTQAGFSFAFSGVLSTAGVQPVTLLAVGGPPSGTGAQNFTVTLGTSTCTFSVPMAGPATYTINCPGVVVNGTYQAGTALDPLTNTISIPVNTTTAGTYSIGPLTINGMSFSGSGTLALGAGTITLAGTGTPTTATGSPFSLNVNGCLVPITVTAAPVIDWSFKIGSVTYSGSTSDVVGLDNTSFPPFTLVDYYGEYLGNIDKFNLLLGDPAGGVFTAGETYNTNITTLANGAYFYFDGLPGLELEASDPTTTPGVNIVVTITSHNTATKTIIGTFQGTALDYVSNTTKTITNGTFKIVYPN